MKLNKVYIAFIIILTLTLVAVFAYGCKNNGTTPEANATEGANTEEPVITASPDGEVTASPTQAPADNTESADPSVTEPGTTEAGETEPAGSSSPGVTEPAGTGGTPILTTAPGGTAAAETPYPTFTMPSTPVLTLNPTASPTQAPGTTPTPRPTPMPNNTPAPTQLPDNDYEAHYAGATVDCTAVSVGGTFFWTFDLLNEHSCLFAGHWLVDYNEKFLKVENYSVSWSGGLTYAINQTWDNEEAWSDKPAVVCNEEYMGQTGGSPQGEAGNLYANMGMYLTSFDYNGVQMAGSLIRFKFSVKKMPATSDMLHDNGGYYLEIPITVIESTAMYPVDNPEMPFGAVTHGNITCEPGKLYFKH